VPNYLRRVLEEQLEAREEEDGAGPIETLARLLGEPTPSLWGDEARLWLRGEVNGLDAKRVYRFIQELGMGGVIPRIQTTMGYLGWSILVGAGLIGLFVFGAFDGSQPPNAPDDPGLGLGAMLVTAALTPILAALLWLGGGIGILFRRMRS
jgi:hypothetical protein